MKARVHHVCLPRSKRVAYDTENICIDIDLEVLPQIGSMLKVAPNGEYLKVEDVYLDVTPGGEGLSIHIEEPDRDDDLRPWPEMKIGGWKLANAG
jgi:hypothetical protein